MERAEWLDQFDILAGHLAVIRGWDPALPEPTALRCERSRHRTLAHLRACQEQWLSIVNSFIERESPSVKILHPWRQFDAGNYADVAWEIHMENFVEDRARWMALRDTADWNRGGKWNQKPDTIGGLTKRLAGHEAHHMAFFT